jgi:hypothetical protein
MDERPLGEILTHAECYMVWLVALALDVASDVPAGTMFYLIGRGERVRIVKLTGNVKSDKGDQDVS